MNNNRWNMRHWSERMNPANFGLGGRQPNMPGMMAGAVNKPMTGPPSDAPIYYGFNVPFASDLAGPNVEDILHATRDAVLRWTHPVEAPADVPIFDLPVHAQNLDRLRKMCEGLSNGPLPIEGQVFTAVSEKKELTTTVVLSGSPELVYKSRETILNDLPHSMLCDTVDVTSDIVYDLPKNEIKASFTDHLDFISTFAGVDIFLLGPKLTPVLEGLNSECLMRVDQRWRIAVYGTPDAVEHAKTRVLIQIDKILGRAVDALAITSGMHLLAGGRNKKNIKLIESETGTAIYFPLPYSLLTRYLAKGSQPRKSDEIYITGLDPNSMLLAKQRLARLAETTNAFNKDGQLSPAKIDSMMLTHADKIRKILEANGAYLLWPCLGAQRNIIRVQGNDRGAVEETITDITGLASQFYCATWWVQPADPRHNPTSADVRTTIGDICAKSKADMLFEKLSSFTLTGFDDAVKEGLHVMSEIPFFTQGSYQIKLKIELSNDHKEFISGKKNGKINKIMGQSNVQIMFDGFTEWNFHIDVNAGSYTQLKHGLDLVEAEMPASISFHVPDQYHKRIIGIGGQHIQRIMKKHSVFVKFSNAMDRGGLGRDDDDVKVDNVVCRTPARNAQNLEAVKTEILEMVDQDDSELTVSNVNVDRLYHRTLLMQLAQIEQLEKTWNCKCTIPSSEHASDEIVVKGPVWRVPHFVDALLCMVPDGYDLVVPYSKELAKFLESPAFTEESRRLVREQHEVELSVLHDPDERTEDDGPTITFHCKFTRNNAGSVRDVQEYLERTFVKAGLNVPFVKGCIERPRSNTYSAQSFDSKLLLPIASEPPESPARSTFGDDQPQNRTNNLATFGRKLSSMSSLSSFLDRRKNSSQARAGLFKGSANVSKTSLISLESTRSFNLERNPWNDSGVNLNDDDSAHSIWGARPFSNGSSSIDHTKLSAAHGISSHNNTNGGTPGDVTPRHNNRRSGDSGRPSTSHSTSSGYPGPAFGPFR